MNTRKYAGAFKTSVVFIILFVGYDRYTTTTSNAEVFSIYSTFDIQFYNAAEIKSVCVYP